MERLIGKQAPYFSMEALSADGEHFVRVALPDYAAKAANVRLMEIRIARGLGGKGFVILTGEVSAVRSAVKAAMNQLEETGDITSSSVIASPHPGLIDKLTN